MKQTLVRLSPKTHTALRVAVAKKGISLNTALTEAVELWLKKNSKFTPTTKK